MLNEDSDAINDQPELYQCWRTFSITHLISSDPILIDLILSEMSGSECTIKRVRYGCNRSDKRVQLISFWLAAAMANWVASQHIHSHPVQIKSGQLRRGLMRRVIWKLLCTDTFPRHNCYWHQTARLKEIWDSLPWRISRCIKKWGGLPVFFSHCGKNLQFISVFWCCLQWDSMGIYRVRNLGHLSLTVLVRNSCRSKTEENQFTGTVWNRELLFSQVRITARVLCICSSLLLPLSQMTIMATLSSVQEMISIQDFQPTEYKYDIQYSPTANPLQPENGRENGCITGSDFCNILDSTTFEKLRSTSKHIL